MHKNIDYFGLIGLFLIFSVLFVIAWNFDDKYGMCSTSPTAKQYAIEQVNAYKENQQRAKQYNENHPYVIFIR